ncbi:TIGR03752 family integrating conjugative element protein [Legionella sp.]|uniref:TIGR03752 family integrating conjugative element protein n=1 Tax=Legionella sp. TaxID=459 RepID=UPI000CB27A9A|nr:TIGR03752 family integrating conjugative element protein [Legionella sp.]PJE14467.1 MAG: TIGR03752 family integrating conjugative element protein [Legionella sp.]
MKKNISLKVLTGVVVGVVALVLINSGKGGPSQAAESKSDPNNLNEAISSQFNDNIRDVSARLVQTEQKMRAIEIQNKTLAEKNAELTASKEEGGVVIRQELAPEVVETMEALKKELAQLKESQTPQGDSERYPLGQVASNGVLTAPGAVYDIDNQLMKHPLSEQEVSYWNKLNARRKQIQKSVVKKSKTIMPSQEEKEKGIPYYTIPAGSDLGNTTLLSALIGEVPIDGKLMQPLFPFSAIISRGDLMASNGVPLPPDISGMKISGYAIGVGSFLDNISCARAYVTSVLFTFQDGHFVVVGKDQMSNSVDLVNNESLGYLTTAYGNPCIHGKYYTNAPRVLMAMMATGGAQGVGNALSQWQMTYFAGPNGATAAPTGSFGPYAAGGALSEGTAKGGDWLEKRIQGSFDMVFVPASVPYRIGAVQQFRPNRMSLHLTQTINLDKQPQGRVLDYGHLQHYTHDFSLK